MSAFFVTGTDTDVGKTFVSCALLNAARKQGLSTLGLKPVSAGCESIDGVLKNEDALRLQNASTIQLPYSQVNPSALKEACSPHIAASLTNKTLSASRLAGYCRGAMMNKADFTIVEGAGGWRVPISPRETMADLAKHLALPVLLVVDMRLGCINHALLTADAIRSDGLKLAGWVANQVSADAMGYLDENLQTLRSALGVPFVGFTGHLAGEQGVSECSSLDIDCLTV